MSGEEHRRGKNRAELRRIARVAYGIIPTNSLKPEPPDSPPPPPPIAAAPIGMYPGGAIIPGIPPAIPIIPGEYPPTRSDPYPGCDAYASVAATGSDDGGYPCRWVGGEPAEPSESDGE